MARMWWGDADGPEGSDARQRHGNVEEVPFATASAARGTQARRRGRSLPGAAALLLGAAVLALAVAAGSSDAGGARLLGSGASDALQESSVSVSVLRALRAQQQVTSSQSQSSESASESQALEPQGAEDSAALRAMGGGGAGARVEGNALRAEQDATAVGVVGLFVEANVVGAIAGWPRQL